MFRDALEAAVRGDDRLSLLASASDGPSALELIIDRQPDVAVLDVRMGDPDGIEVTERARAHGIRTRVLLVSAHDQPRLARRAIQAGAAGYLVKNIKARELADAIVRVAAGELVLSTALQERLLTSLRDLDASKATGVELSRREQAVIQLTARGRNPRQIASELALSPHTVKDYLHRAYTKLGVTDRTAAVAEALRRDLIE